MTGDDPAIPRSRARIVLEAGTYAPGPLERNDNEA